MQLSQHLQALVVPIHRAGWPFIGIALVLSILLGFLAQPLLWLGLLVTGWIAYFFRDPPRVTPEGDELVVSPADGSIVAITPRVPPPELEIGDQPRTCISIFLNIFNVHINRAPVGGRVAHMAYRPGKFFNAALDKASEENERQSLRIETPQGEIYGVVLIAGLVARRIVPFIRQGQSLFAGERIALIRFGSRCDIYLPDGMTPVAVVGQRTFAGETVLADGRRNQPLRTGRRS